jgi:hypothetical protein
VYVDPDPPTLIRGRHGTGSRQINPAGAGGSVPVDDSRGDEMIRWAWRFAYTFSLCVLVVQYNASVHQAW